MSSLYESVCIVTGDATSGEECSELRGNLPLAGESRRLGGVMVLWSPGRAACLGGREAMTMTGVSCILFMLNLRNLI